MLAKTDLEYALIAMRYMKARASLKSAKAATVADPCRPVGRLGDRDRLAQLGYKLAY